MSELATNLPSGASANLLLLNHQIRQSESYLSIARSRRRWSNLSLVFGPVLLVVLYGILWIPNISHKLILAVYLPCIPIVIGFCVASVRLKATPGGPRIQQSGSPAKKRTSEYQLELTLAQQRDQRRELAARAETPTKVRRVAYKDDASSEIDNLRVESTGYRRVNNALQTILIVGSLAATGASAITGQFPDVRWVTLGITFIVGIASGFMGYFKYKERSFYLQQTADAIESEWEAVEVGIGHYKKFYEDDDEDGALAAFVEELHRLKSEQKKRQQNLEQPPDMRNSQDT